MLEEPATGTVLAPPAEPPDAPTATALHPLSSSFGYGAELVAFASVIGLTLLGTSMFARTPLVLTLGPLAGLACGLASRRWWAAALCAAGGVLVGMAAWPLVSPSVAGVDLAAIGVAAVLGALVSLALSQSDRLRPLIAALALVVVIGTMWYATVIVGVTVWPSLGFSPADKLSGTPDVTRITSDADIYLLWVRRLSAGEKYYPMAADVLRHANIDRPNVVVPLRSPLSYRLPTLYWLLSKLPPAGIWIIIAAASLGTLSTVSAFWIAQRFVVFAPALVSAVGVASVVTLLNGPPYLYAETWAGMLWVIAIAFAVASRTYRSRALAFTVAAAAVAFLSATVRELSLAFLLLGLIAVLADKDARSRRLWVPWTVAVLAALGVYALHWSAVAEATRALPVQAIRLPARFSANGEGLHSLAVFVAQLGLLRPIVPWGLFALGAIGSVLASRDRVVTLMLAGVAVGGLVALFVVHAPGTTSAGVSPAYWGYLLLPTVLACVPFAFAWLPGVRRVAEKPSAS